MLTRSKLAVIVHADVVGSTALVQQDEAVAHERIRDTFRHLSELIASYSGLTHELRGDALVGEFERVSDAVSAALAFQLANQARNEALGTGIRPQVRIGIALGEVVVADGTVTGAGVVLAQRLEQLASAHGLCISAAVHEALPARLPFHYQFLGERNLKGFDDPMRVYAVGVAPGAPVPAPEPTGSRRSRPHREHSITHKVAIVAVILVLGAIAGRFAMPPDTRQDEATTPVPAVPLSRPVAAPDIPAPSTSMDEEKPSVAVLAFANLSDDPEQEHFADGVALDLITDLSKVAGLLVISRGSSFSFKGKDFPTKEIARLLNVSYILGGSVRRAGQTLRLNVELIDTDTDTQTWAERFDGSTDDIFAFQDQVVKAVASAVAKSLTPPETKSDSDRPKNLAAYDNFLRGWSLSARRNANDARTAVAHFRRALELDPAYQRAQTGLAKTLWEMADYGQLSDDARFRSFRAEAWQLLKALLPSNDPVTLSVYAQMLAGGRLPDRAVAAARRALELDANNVEAVRTIAWVFAMSGRREGALWYAERSLRLDPLAPWSAHAVRGLVSYEGGDHETAVDQLRLALSGGADTISWHVLLAASLVGAGDLAGGRQALEVAKGKLRYAGSATVGRFMIETSMPINQQALSDRIAGALGAMGVPGADQYMRATSADRADGRALREAIFGRTIRVNTTWVELWSSEPASSVDVVVAADGVVMFASGGYPFPVGSQISVEDDLLCSQWRYEGDVCLPVFRNPAGGTAQALDQFVALNFFTTASRYIRVSTESHAETQRRYRRVVDEDMEEAFFYAPLLEELTKVLSSEVLEEASR